MIKRTEYVFTATDVHRILEDASDMNGSNMTITQAPGDGEYTFTLTSEEEIGS